MPRKFNCKHHEWLPFICKLYITSNLYDLSRAPLTIARIQKRNRIPLSEVSNQFKVEFVECILFMVTHSYC